MSKILYFLQVLIVTYLLFGLWLYMDQRHHIYHPNPMPVQKEQLPGFVEKTIRTEDGVTLHAWLHPGKPTLVYFQGNSGNSGEKYRNVKPFIDKGWGVLLAPYRGYGGNPGKPSEENFYMDAEASLGLIQKMHTSCIVIFGRSLGSTVATYIARKYNAAALILISPLTSVPEVAQSYYPIYPVKWLTSDKFNSFDRINLVNMPLLIMHGTDDHVVPYSHGLRLYEHAMKPKKLITLENKDHNDISNEVISKAVFEFTKPYIKHCPKTKLKNRS